MQKIKILVDLKPALDGLGGIPCECRILFQGLRALKKNFDVDGLIQHARNKLPAHSRSDKASYVFHESAFEAAKTVIALSDQAGERRNYNLLEKAQIYVEIQKLRLLAWFGRTIKLGHFNTGLFADFVWSRLFSISLTPDAKQSITSAVYRIVNLPRAFFQLTGRPNFAPGLLPVTMTLDTNDYDIIIVQSPYPAKVSKGTRLIIRYHDSVPILAPHTIQSKDKHLAVHYENLVMNVKAGAHFVCNSESTRQDLIKLFPELKTRSSVIYNIINSAFGDKSNSQTTSDSTAIINRIVETRRTSSPSGQRPKPTSKIERYLLMVSTLEPRKNHRLLIRAYEDLIARNHEDLKLIFVGSWGWNYDDIAKEMAPLIEYGQLIHLSGLPPTELCRLYQGAAATICPSIFEGFDYSGVEAMACGGLVIASDIPVHREIYGKGADYFDAYDASNAASLIDHLISSEGKKDCQALQTQAKLIAQKYTYEAVMPQWSEFLTAIIGREQ